MMLLAGIGWMVWFYAQREMEIVREDVPDIDPLIGATLTLSQKATVKYFLVVTLLFLLQIIMGIVTAHYGVEAPGFTDFRLADFCRMSSPRHIAHALGIFGLRRRGLPPYFLSRVYLGFEPKNKARR